MAETDDDALAELVTRLSDGEFVEYLLDSDAAEEIVRWVQEETGIKSRSLIRVFIKQLLKVAVGRGKVFAESKAASLSTSAYKFLRGIKGFQFIARGLLAVLDKVINKQLDEQLLKDIIAGRRPARDAAEAQTLSREFCAQMSVLADLEQLTRELAASLQEQQHPQPRLDLPLFPVTAATRMHFAARSVPFLGRDREFQALRNYLTDSSDFSWWLMTGPGGLGKSRLALEFCLRHGNAWRMGFLPGNIGSFDWAAWQPEEPTFIVVDYAANRAAEIGNVIRAMYFRAESPAAPVRLLLLERQVDDGWWKQFLGDQGTRDRHAVELSRYAEPLALEPMTRDQLIEVMTHVSPGLGDASREHLSEVAGRLAEIDPKGRPLFAAVAADAIEHGRNLREWDAEQLLGDLLGRERDRTWARVGAGSAEENLLALATLANGLPLSTVKEPPAGLELPAPDKALQTRYEAMTGKVLDKTFQPLEPDIVGEYFVLEHLRDEGVFGEPLLPAFWDVAFRQGDPFVLLSRVVQDFPSHPTTFALATQCFESIRLEEQLDDWLVQTWFMRWADLPPTAVRAGHFELADQLITAFGSWAEHNVGAINPVHKAPYPIVLWYGGSAALTAVGYVAQTHYQEAYALTQRFVAFLDRTAAGSGEQSDDMQRFEVLALEALLDEAAADMDDEQVKWLAGRVDQLDPAHFSHDREVRTAGDAILHLLDLHEDAPDAEWARWREKLRQFAPEAASDPVHAGLRVRLLVRELTRLHNQGAPSEKRIACLDEMADRAMVPGIDVKILEDVANRFANDIVFNAEEYGPEASKRLWLRFEGLFPPCPEDIRNALLIVAASGVVPVLIPGDIDAAASIAEALHIDDDPHVNEKIRVHYGVIQQALGRACFANDRPDAGIARLKELDDLVAQHPEEPHLTTIRDQLLLDFMSSLAGQGDLVGALNLFMERYAEMGITIKPEYAEMRYWQSRVAAVACELLCLTGDVEQSVQVYNFLSGLRRTIQEESIDSVVQSLRRSLAAKTLYKNAQVALQLLEEWAGEEPAGESAQTRASWLLSGLELTAAATKMDDGKTAHRAAYAISGLLDDPGVLSAAREMVNAESEGALEGAIEVAQQLLPQPAPG
jgi:hypothetical protein